MRRIQYITISCLLLAGTFKLSSQSVNLDADTVEGCDSINVHFSLVSVLGGKTLENYTWQFGDGTFVTNNSATQVKKYNVPGVYRARVLMKLVGDATVYSDSIRIFIRPHPNANFFVADTFQLGNLTYYFRSGKAPVDSIKYQYVWTLNPDDAGNYDYRKIHTTANYITNAKRDTLIYTFSQTRSNVMRLKVTDYYGCVDSFQQIFNVSEKLFVPDIFTPNGDNVNDFFIVQTNGRTVFSFKVYSITGQLVFKSESRSIIWDGKMSNGSKAWPGNYLYIIESVSGEPVKRQTGFFMLLR